MAEVVFFVGGFLTDPQAKQNHDIGKEIRGRVNGVCNEGLAVAEYTCQKLEGNKEDINTHAEQRHRFAGSSCPCPRCGLGFFRQGYHKVFCCISA